MHKTGHAGLGGGLGTGISIGSFIQRGLASKGKKPKAKRSGVWRDMILPPFWFSFTRDYYYGLMLLT